MSNQIGIVDNVTVGPYPLATPISSSNEIPQDGDNYVITGDADADNLNANAQLIFKNNKLNIGDNPDPQYKLEVNGGNNEDLLLIKNQNNKGVKIKGDGVLQLTEFSSLPTPQEGGIIYSNNNFFVGI